MTQDLFPETKMSLDALRTLQLERLKTVLRHAYEHQAPYRAKCQAAGVHPDDLRQARRSPALSLHRQDRSARRLSLRHAGHPARTVRAHPCLERHDRPADRGRLLGARHRHLGGPDGALALRRRRAAGRRHPQCLRLRPVHRRPRRALRRRAAGLHRGADVGRLRRAPGPAHPRVRRAGRADDAVLHAGDRRRVRTPGRRSAQHRDAGRPVRRRALDRGHARRDRAAARHRRRRPLRPERSDGAGRGLRVRRDQGRADDLGGPFLSGDRRSRVGSAGARWSAGRAGADVAHQAGDAGHPLPHARPHAPACRDRSRRSGAWPRSPAAATTC